MSIIKKLLFRLAHFQFIKRIHLRLLSIAARYGLFSDIWYLCSGGFRREHKAVLNGRLLHKVSFKAKNSCGALYTLRRNTHRLEKGLIMKPRRSVFAIAFITETVAMYESLVSDNATTENQKTLNWSHDVLENYFDCVDLSNSTIAAAKVKFDACNVPATEKTKLKPYVRALDSKPAISIDDLHKLAIHRRSCRWFKPDRVPRNLIDRAIEVGTLAPSACNRQPFEFRIFDDPELAQKVGAIPGGTSGFFHNFPCVAVLIGDLSAFPAERDRHLPYIDGSLAAMGFQFGLEVQGLSSCCINWPDLESRERAIEKLLGLNIYQRVIMLIALGYPDDQAMVPYSQKKAMDEIRSYQTHVN